MPNMNQVLSKHNAKVRNKQAPKPNPGCNCRGGPPKCPVGGSCLTPGVVYQATVGEGGNSIQGLLLVNSKSDTMNTGRT